MIFYDRISHVASIEAYDFGMEKYPRGRRGGFAKALGGVTAARGFDSLLLRHIMYEFGRIRLESLETKSFRVFYFRFL